MGKPNYGPYNVTQGGNSSVIVDPVVPYITGTSGATEPAWPTTPLDKITDGGITWTAILARVVTGSVLGMVNRCLFQHSLSAYPDHYFQYGRVKFTSGANIGRVCDIRDSLGTSAGIPYIFALEIFPYPMVIGDTFIASVGCAKIRNACQSFNNLDNHRAFPDMPTEDRALQTPNISAQGYAPRQTK